MVEPPLNANTVDMLAALSPEESLYYSCEDHVVDYAGKSMTIFREVERQYGFVGGSETQYLRYLHREDVAPLWNYTTADRVRAIAGIS